MKFETITEEQFISDVCGFDQYDIQEMYSCLKIPKRATPGSAGYDFFMPYSLTLGPGATELVPTGIKVELNKNCFLAIYPRSSLGFKYRMKICNTVGIIDADYYNNEKNEGHIMIKIENCGTDPISLQEGEAFAQGIIQQYYLTDDDEPRLLARKGGMGSTSNK